MSKTIKIFHFFPDKLNLYGDIGNVTALKKRSEWRGLNVEVVNVTASEKVDLSEADILFIGGGSDREQKIATLDIFNVQEEFRALIEDGIPALMICGGYQFLGHSYVTADGTELETLNILDFRTESKVDRLTGNIILESEQFGKIVGFENHGGRTYHNYEPLGTVVSGYGNNAEDGGEGIHYKNMIGTYLHGPLLPKNPKITDYLIDKACERKGIDVPPAYENNDIEERAAEVMIERLLSNNK